MLKKFDEAERLKEVNSYNIENTPNEKEYDDIAFLASIICGTPIALVTMMYQDRQWFKAAVGTDLKENKRELSFCTHAMAGDEKVMVVEDANTDERFKNNPLVKSGPQLAFYAGASIVNKNGYCIGTICVYDLTKKSLTEHQIQGLQILSEQVMGLLELRKQNFQLEMMAERLEISNKSLEAFAMVLAHDLKSPLSSVSLANEMLEAEASELKFEVKDLTDIIKRNSEKMQRLVNGILNNAKINDKHNVVEAIEPVSFFNQLKSSLFCPKPFNFTCFSSINILYFNKIQLEQIFNNLFTNAIRYNDKEKVELKVEAHEQNGFYHFEVTDNGMGISKENQSYIFQLFRTVDDKDNYGFESSGIGLSIVKKIITAADGNINVASVQGEYTSFSFSLKVPEKK